MKKNKDPSKGGDGDKSDFVSPTYLSMKNSFIIQNADQTFDQYYTGMKKRK